MPVEENDVQLESHPERVDASTARNQQAVTGGGRFESRQAEQPGATVGGDPDRHPTDLLDREPLQPPG